MLPTTQAFKNAVVASHQVITKAEVHSPDGTLLYILPFSAGTDKGGASLSAGAVTLDGENNIRRSLSLSLLTNPNNTLVPANYSSLLAPFANELYVYRGIQYPTAITLLDGSVSNQEYVRIGTFVIASFDATQTNDGIAMTLTGEDRSNHVTRNTWQVPYQMTSGAELSVALQAMISFLYPACQFNFTPTGFTIGTIVFGTTVGGDPWADAVRLANLCAQDLFFDANGICILRPLPVLANSVPTTTQMQGSQRFTIVQAERSLDNKNVFNNIVLDVQPTDGTNPYRVVAGDQDPNSPTYVGGSFGTVTKNITTSVPTSQAQAVAVAVALLNQNIGAQDAHTYAMVCDPSLDVFDILQVAITGLNVNSNLILDSATIPLDATTTGAIVCRTIITRNAVQT